MKSTKKEFRMRARVNMGNVILLAARTYDTLLKVVNELAQNIIDSRASKGKIVIDIPKSCISGYDNGKGASTSEIENKIQTIGLSTKTEEDIGEKGFGFLAGLGIGHTVALLTHPVSNPQENFFKVSLAKKDLKDKPDVDFPCELMGKGFKIGEQTEKWTTVQTVRQIEKSALRCVKLWTNPLETVCDSIASAFRSKIEQTGIEITVCFIDEGKITKEGIVRPLQYPGKRETEEIETVKGPVTFEMFLTNTIQKKPQIMVDHQHKISFPLQNMSDLWEQVSDVLDSGYFQGRFHLDFCTRTEDHQKFVWDEECDVFIQAVIEFVVNVARPWLQGLKQGKKNERIEEATRKALSKADEFFKKNPKLLDDMFKAAVSKGHKDTFDKPETKQKLRTKKYEKRESDVPSLKPESDKDRRKGKRKKKHKEKDMSHPAFTSTSGQKRVSLKGECGLQIIHVEGMGNWLAKIGDKGENKGKILLNVAHPEFAECLEKGTKSKELDVYITLLLMQIAATPLMGYHKNIFQELFQCNLMAFREMLC